VSYELSPNGLASFDIANSRPWPDEHIRGLLDDEGVTHCDHHYVPYPP
jgi:hypothetical protein